MLTGEGSQRGREDARECGRDVADSELLHRLPAKSVHVGSGLTGLAQDVTGVGEITFTGQGQRQPGLLAREQCDAEFIFQVVNLPAHGGL